MSTTAVAPSDHSGEYTHRQILTILTGLLLGMFLGSLDQTIVSTSIRTIADDLHGLSAQAWVTTAYLITSTITTPIYGKLGDLWGRKKLFMFSISVFIVGSALCTFSTSMYELAGFRAFQGLGAGGLFTLVLAIVGDIVSPRERAKYTGYFMATFGSSSVLGPVIGGLLAGTGSILGIAGWRWVFLVNVPIGIVALAVVFRTLHVHHEKREAKVDWLGALMLVVCLVPWLTVAEQGQDWGWGSGRAIVCLVIGAIGLAAFIAVEAKLQVNALIPLRLFKIKAASVTIVASIIVGMGMFGAMMLLPLYMQIVHGATPTESGFLMLPMVVGLMTAALVSGKVIAKTGKPRIFPIVGSLVMAIGMFLLTQISADTHLWIVMILMFVTGHGIGYCMQPLILTIQSAVPPTAIGVATSSATFFRQIGGTVGVALFLSILFSSVQASINDAFTDAAKTPAFQHAAQTALASGDKKSPDYRLASGDKTVLAGITKDSSIIKDFDPELAHPIKVGFSDSITRTFWISGSLGILACLVLTLMPEVELRATSAQAAARSGAAPPGETPDPAHPVQSTVLQEIAEAHEEVGEAPKAT